MVVETRSAKKAKLLQTPKTIGRNGTMTLVVPSATGKGKRTLYSYPSGYDALRRAAPKSKSRRREESVETEIAGEEDVRTGAAPSLNQFITPHPSTVLTPEPPMAPKKVVPITARTILDECRRMPIFRLEEECAAQTPTPSPTKKLATVASARRLGPEETVLIEESANYESLGSPFRMQGSKPVVGDRRPTQFGPHGTEVIGINLTEGIATGKNKTIIIPSRVLKRR